MLWQTETEQQGAAGRMTNEADTGGALAKLQTETAIEIDAMLPSILDKAFKEELGPHGADAQRGAINGHHRRISRSEFPRIA